MTVTECDRLIADVDRALIDANSRCHRLTMLALSDPDDDVEADVRRALDDLAKLQGKRAVLAAELVHARQREREANEKAIAEALEREKATFEVELDAFVRDALIFEKALEVAGSVAARLASSAESARVTGRRIMMACKPDFARHVDSPQFSGAIELVEMVLPVVAWELHRIVNTLPKFHHHVTFNYTRPGNGTPDLVGAAANAATRASYNVQDFARRVADYRKHVADELAREAAEEAEAAQARAEQSHKAQR